MPVKARDRNKEKSKAGKYNGKITKAKKKPKPKKKGYA